MAPLGPFLLAATRTDLGGWRWTDLPPGWVLTLVTIGFFFFLRALYRWERGRAGMVTRMGLAALRTVVLLLLLLVLAGPYREEVRTAEERSHLVLLVDTSGSMGTSDRYPPAEIDRLRDVAWGDGAMVSDEAVCQTSRLELVQRVFGAEGEGLLREFDRRFVLHVFAFDVDWRSLGSTPENTPGEAPAGEGSEDPVAHIAEAIRGLEAAGGGTDIGSVLRNVAGEFLGREDRPLAGVLLVSDGRNTSGGEGPLETLVRLGVQRGDLRVTAIALGNASSGRNVRVERIRAMDVVLVEDDVVFETAIRHRGFPDLGGVRAVATITKVADADGKPLDPPRPYEPPEGAVLEVGPFRLGAENEPVPVRLLARMSEAGTFEVRVEVVLRPDDAKEDAIRDDDVACHEIRVVDQRIKILYVDHYPRYEYRFLSSWLTREPTPDPARPERRSRYETQVLLQSADPTVRLPHSPTVQDLRTFPSRRSELFAYDVLVLGDIDWMHLGETAQASRRILELIRDFVDEGGGIVLQAGEDYGNPLGFRDTPLEDLLPIRPRDHDENASDETTVPFRIRLTDVGRQHPIFGAVPGRDGGIASPEEVELVWRGKAPFARFARDWKWYWIYRATSGLGPGAVALARVETDEPLDRSFLDDTGRPVVVFATMRFGRGRVFWSSLDSIWRIRRGQGDRFYGPFWDQVVRYLATYRLLGGNKRFKISTDKETYYAGETATVTITALDRDYEPMDADWLDGVHVETPDGEHILLRGDQRPANLTPEGAAPGTYRMYLSLARKGTYRVWISDTGTGAGRDRGYGSRAERRIEVVFRAPELRLTIPDHELLHTIVEETDGRLLDHELARLYDLEDLARGLPARTAQRVLDRRERTQWDKSWVLLLLVGLLGVEWAVRKRWQMI